MNDFDLDARRAAAEERIRVANEKRNAKAKSEELLALEKLERDAVEAEAIADAEATYGAVDEDIKVVRSPRGIVIVKRPAFVIVKRFHDAGKFSVEAKDKLGRPCVVYPNAAEYAKMAADDVALVVAVADAAAWLAGFGRTKLEEKADP